jgi:hypothetical protein
MAGSADSNHFEVKGSAKRSYTVTINYGTGHWCTCPGMISKKKTWGDGTGRTKGTSCKHVTDIINSKFDGDWGEPGGQGKPRTPNKPVASTPTTPAQPTGRRAAIMAQRAKREQKERVTSPSSGLSLLDRIAALESAREGALS